MEQEIVWVLKRLILPPGSLVLLGLLGLLLSKRIIGRLLLLLTLSGLYLLATPTISQRLMANLEIIAPLTEQQLKVTQAQAIVVLGAGRRFAAPEYLGQDTVNQKLLERLRYAAWLSKRSGLPVIPSGGSPQRSGTTEAQLAQSLLINEFGVKVAAIEASSLNTKDHGHLLPPLLNQLNIQHIIVVTHAWHMLRTLDVFEEAGISATAAPMGFEHTNTQEGHYAWLPNAGALEISALALHEYLGRWWYRLRR